MPRERRPFVPLTETLSWRHLPALDGLRAIAVLTVMVYHFGVKAVPGDLGVSAFFVLSGFLITLLLLREHERHGDVSLRGFYLRRTLRIFPAYYAYLAFSFAIDHVRHDPWSPTLIWSSLLYVVNYFNAFNNHPTTSVAHAWSLAVEEQFYLLWPLAFLAVASRGRRALSAMLASSVVVVLLWRSYLFLVRDVGSAYVYNAFDTRFDNLAVGCLLAVLATRPWLARGAALVAGRSWYPLLTMAAIVVSRTAISATYHYTTGFTVDALLVAVLIVQLLQLHGSALWRWLAHPVTRYLGAISYPMYLYHGWGLAVGHHLPWLPWPLQLLVGTLATVLLATGSYRMVEQPFLRLKERLERRRTGAAVPGTAVAP
jgi:peptidoglycan/LPS O-acetylase OafA/YrhL